MFENRPGNPTEQFYLQIVPKYLSITSSGAIHTLKEKNISYKLKLLKGAQKTDEMKNPIVANPINGKIFFQNAQLNLFVPTNRNVEYTLDLQEKGEEQKIWSRVGSCRIMAKYFIDEFQGQKTLNFNQNIELSKDFSLNFDLYINNTRIALQKFINEDIKRHKQEQKSPCQKIIRKNGSLRSSGISVSPSPSQRSGSQTTNKNRNLKFLNGKDEREKRPEEVIRINKRRQQSERKNKILQENTKATKQLEKKRRQTERREQMKPTVQKRIAEEKQKKSTQSSNNQRKRENKEEQEIQYDEDILSSIKSSTNQEDIPSKASWETPLLIKRTDSITDSLTSSQKKRYSGKSSKDTMLYAIFLAISIILILFVMSPSRKV